MSGYLSKTLPRCNKIAKEATLNGEIEKAGRILDLYYISTRYPDNLPDGMMPSEYFSKEQAEDALKLAILIYNEIKKLITK